MGWPARSADVEGALSYHCGGPAVRAKVKGRRTVGPAAKQRIRATLRSAIGTYLKQRPGLLDVNAAALVGLPSGKRPHPLVWTSEHRCPAAPRATVYSPPQTDGRPRRRRAGWRR
jgi:hypothetical protein